MTRYEEKQSLWTILEENVTLSRPHSCNHKAHHLDFLGFEVLYFPCYPSLSIKCMKSCTSTISL